MIQDNSLMLEWNVIEAKIERLKSLSEELIK